MYNKRTWLNKDNSPSTGNIVAFEGEVLWKGEKIPSAFLSISDCNVSARLHKTDEDTIEDFIEKMKLLKSERVEYPLELIQGQQYIKKLSHENA